MKFVYHYILLLLVIASACKAPRTNPLDPENEDNRIYSISGVVKGQGFPNLPIEGVRVVWNNSGKFAFTDKDGFFVLTELGAIDGWISFEKSGYTEVESLVVWDNARKIEMEAHLNQIPVLDSLEFYSIVENKSQFSDPKSTLTVRARISDNDGEGDIDSVWITNSELNFEAALDENSSTRFYEKTLKISDLGIISFEEIIGKKFKIHVLSLEKIEYVIGSANLTRVISEVLQTIAPQNNTVVMEFPFELEWNRFTPGYNFTYYVQIKTDESQPELTWEKRYISRDDISTTIDFNIPQGDYFWVIWCEDEFGNRGSSYNSTFTIPEKTTKHN